MKKLFVALMAVLVLASCGDNKKVATPADLMVLTAETMNGVAEKIKNAEDVDAVIDATAEFYSEMKAMDEKYGEVAEALNGMEQDEVTEKYPAEAEALQAAATNFAAALMEKSELMEGMTPEQEARLMEVFEGM